MRIFPNLRGKLELFNSLDTLRILDFWQITKDKNVCLLDKNYSKTKKYTKNEVKICEDLWLKLFDDYYKLRDNKDSKSNLIKSFDELKLREKITQINNAIDFLESLKKQIGFISNDDIIKYEQECYAMLKKIDKRIKPLFFEGIDANIVNLGKVLKSFINKYNIAFKEKEKVVKKEVKNVYDIVANAESWLERNLDVENMTVSRWIAYEKQIADKQKAQQKNGKR
jgi:hypothetical protein